MFSQWLNVNCHLLLKIGTRRQQSCGVLTSCEPAFDSNVFLLWVANIKSFVKEFLAVAPVLHRFSFPQTWNVEIDETCCFGKTCAFLAGVVGSGLVLPVSSVLALRV